MGLRHVILSLAMVALAPAMAAAQGTEVTFAGVAYSGTEASVPRRFPYSSKYEALLKAADDSAYKKALSAITQTPAGALRISTDRIEELKGHDQALVVSLVLGSETVSVERFGDVRKLFVLVRGQALFFDFKSMTVVRSYPLSFGYVDNFKRDPTPQEVLERVRMVYEGTGGKPGLFGRFAQALSTATVPTQTPRFLQVTKVNLSAEMLAAMPDSLKSDPGVYEAWAADLVGEAISTRVGVPVVPYTKSYAINKVMSMQVMDGDVYNLTLPTPDYEISVDFKGVKKVKYSQSAGGAAFIYGTYADIQIQEPLTGTSYLNTALKNGEVKVVPASQTYVDDFPAYYDSLNGMFVKLASAVAGKGNDWVKTAAAAPDIVAQISKTNGLMNLCK